MKTYQGTTLQSTTDYVGGFVYENGTLSFFGAPEGRVVKNGSALEHQYAIADNQGNTRVVFTSATPAPESDVVNFEASTNAGVQNYNNRVNWELMDHTDAANDGTDYSQKLIALGNSRVGVAKAIKVYPGDKVKIEAYAKYYNATSTTASLTGFGSALLNAFSLSAPGVDETGTPSAALSGWGSFVEGGQNGNSSYPKAFVSLIVFDKNYGFLDAAWNQIDGGEQVGTGTKAAHDYMTQEYTVKEEGYIFAYVSNENTTAVEVYFDDVVITKTKSNVIQYSEYYPFGLQTVSSWTRDNTTSNNFLYNAGNELNQNTGWYEMFYRGYDPATGRMLQVDPYATQFASASVYNYALGNPVMINDPSGGTAWKPRTQQAAEWQLAIMNAAMETALYGRNGMNGDADGSSRWGIAGGEMGRGFMDAWNMAMSQQINSTLGYATDANGYAVIPDNSIDSETLQTIANDLVTNNSNGTTFDFAGGYMRVPTYEVVSIENGNTRLREVDVQYIPLAADMTTENLPILTAGIGSQFISDQWMDMAFLVNDAAQAIYDSKAYKTAVGYRLKDMPVHLPGGIQVRASLSFLRPLAPVISGVAKVAPWVAAGAIATNTLVNKQITAGDIYMATITGLSIVPGFGLIVGGTALLAEGISYGLTGQSISANINESLNGGVVLDWSKK